MNLGYLLPLLLYPLRDGFRVPPSLLTSSKVVERTEVEACLSFFFFLNRV